MWRQLILVPDNCIGIYNAVFISIWLIGWYMNAMHNAHFDLDRLKDIYIWLMTQLNATHAINSVWNSPKGVSPAEVKRKSLLEQQCSNKAEGQDNAS